MQSFTTSPGVPNQLASVGLAQERMMAGETQKITVEYNLQERRARLDIRKTFPTRDLVTFFYLDCR